MLIACCLLTSIIATLIIFYNFICEFSQYMKTDRNDKEIVSHLVFNVVKLALCVSPMWGMFGVIINHAK